ncbi:GtrA family protein [Halotalea alkalilenta]|uniref:GtrA family protein n=1 Tax=Halotalea alkalilenta TaxID=376489 RepID=UPI000694EFEF|nr:GtrA family protein [Halotalea alkalilenta]
MDQENFSFKGFAAHRHPAWLARLARFLAAGGVATLLHWGAMALLVASGVQASGATALAMAAGAGVNYFLQRRYMFSRACGFSLGVYLLSVGMAWSVNLVAFQLLHTSGIGIVLAQLSSTALVALLNFLFLQKFACR